VIGCALTFVLWSVGLRFASPVLVGLTVTLNAVTASLLGALFLAEPIGHELVFGLATVLLGIAIATMIINNKSVS
jgi:drug/metabolite transporter (DMT)-like permease